MQVESHITYYNYLILLLNFPIDTFHGEFLFEFWQRKDTNIVETIYNEQHNIIFSHV